MQQGSHRIGALAYFRRVCPWIKTLWEELQVSAAPLGFYRFLLSLSKASDARALACLPKATTATYKSAGPKGTGGAQQCSPMHACSSCSTCRRGAGWLHRPPTATSARLLTSSPDSLHTALLRRTCIRVHREVTRSDRLCVGGRTRNAAQNERCKSGMTPFHCLSNSPRIFQSHLMLSAVMLHIFYKTGSLFL